MTLHPNMPFFNDKEGDRLPIGLPPLMDSHVHIFPRNILSAVWQWFDHNGWTIRYKYDSTEILDFLLSRGVKQIVALQYSHKPGIARQLNAFMVDQCLRYQGRVTGMATVFPGEEGGEAILQEAFDFGLQGMKLHVHVQCCDITGKDVYALLSCCRANNKPVIIHAGREPKSEAYNCDPYELCSAAKVERILKDFPDLKVCVPHLGFDEVRAYRQMIEKYDNLWLDTAMVITDYFTFEETISLNDYRTDRILFGTDFPNIPYAWDREAKALLASGLSESDLKRMAYGNGTEFFNLDL